MGANLRRLVDRFAQCSQMGGGASLTPQDVDTVLRALREHAGLNDSLKVKVTSAIFRIELMDRQGWPEEVVAIFRDISIARAAFAEAVKDRPHGRLRLRQGARILGVHDAPPNSDLPLEAR